MAVQRRLVHYSGRVQGVGFRYTTQRIGASFAVAGYVRNLPDGRVELVAEGEIREIDVFLEEVRARFDGQIKNEVADTAPATGQFDSFKIRY
jgi:acylphosphatase